MNQMRSLQEETRLLKEEKSDAEAGLSSLKAATQRLEERRKTLLG